MLRSVKFAARPDAKTDQLRLAKVSRQTRRIHIGEARRSIKIVPDKWTNFKGLYFKTLFNDLAWVT